MNTAPVSSEPTIDELRILYEESQKENRKLLSQNTYLKQELAQLKRMLFGQKRERFIPDNNQLTLDISVEQNEPEVITENISYERKKAKKQPGHGRGKLPDHLPRKEIIIEPEEDTTGKEKIGEEITEELEYQPGKLYVNRYIRPKYVDKTREKVFCGILPSRPIEKGIAGPGLLAHILISKYVDHQPIYRQRQRFKREGIRLAESTLGGWISGSSEALKPLYHLIREKIKTCGYLQIDETPVKVQDKKQKGKCHQGYYWVYHSPEQNLLWYDYRRDRSRAGPRRILKDYYGIIQNDGYSSYKEFSDKTGITSVSCMAHIRRYFYQAKDEYPKRSRYMLRRIGYLYKVECYCREKGLSAEERHLFRTRHSIRVMGKIKQWLLNNREEVLPKSAIGKAIHYALGQWPRMENYLKDGRIEIDNNLVENAIRPIALGRKNYLFAGSHDGAANAAIIYTLVVSAKLNDLNPFSYLKDVLGRIADHPHNKLEELLPTQWQPLKSEAGS